MGARSGATPSLFRKLGGFFLITILIATCLIPLTSTAAIAAPTPQGSSTGTAPDLSDQAGIVSARIAVDGEPLSVPVKIPPTESKRAPRVESVTYVSDFEAPAYPFYSIAFHGLWSREIYNGAHGGQLWVCGEEEDALEIGIEVPRNGGKLSLYSARYWQCGYCSFSLVNNATGRVVKSGTVNLYYDNYDSDNPQYDFEVFKVSGLKRGTYTLRVENLGMPGTDQWPQEILEYFESAGIDPPQLPHFINVDYLTLKV